MLSMKIRDGWQSIHMYSVLGHRMKSTEVQLSPGKSNFIKKPADDYSPYFLPEWCSKLNYGTYGEFNDFGSYYGSNQGPASYFYMTSITSCRNKNDDYCKTLFLFISFFFIRCRQSAEFSTSESRGHVTVNGGVVSFLAVWRRGGPMSPRAAENARESGQSFPLFHKRIWTDARRLFQDIIHANLSCLSFLFSSSNLRRNVFFPLDVCN